jgi:hypothetical protein
MAKPVRFIGKAPSPIPQKLFYLKSCVMKKIERVAGYGFGQIARLSGEGTVMRIGGQFYYD